MAIDLEIDWGNLNRLYTNLDQIETQSIEIRDFFTTWVCSAEGFDYDSCALKPIGDMMPTIAGYFTDTQSFFSERWGNVESAIRTTAHDIDLLDGVVGNEFNQNPIVPGSKRYPDVTVEVPELFPLDPVNVHLEEPELGGSELKHDKLFEGAAGIWDEARDTINTAIEGINWAVDKANDILGIFGEVSLGEISPLPTVTLREVVIYPLAGDYRKIRRNANACTQVHHAMSEWGGNFTLLGAKIPLALKGQGGLGLIAQMGAYDIVMKAVGFGIGTGKHAFEWIATKSEQIAVVVEKVMVKVTQRLSKLVAKLGSKFAGPAGWISLAWDLIQHGTGILDYYITEIEEIRAMFDECFALVEEVKNFADVAAQRLEQFQQIIDAVRDLPNADPGGSLGDLSANIDAIQAKLDQISTFGDEDGGSEESSLDTALDDLESLTS